MKKRKVQLKELSAKKKNKKNLLEERLIQDYSKKLQMLVENDISRAETILSIKYINDELIKKSEDISEIIGKNILVISDQLTKEWGEKTSKRFSESVVKSLNQILDQIRNARDEINNFIKSIEQDLQNSSEMNKNLDNSFFSNELEKFEDEIEDIKDEDDKDIDDDNDHDDIKEIEDIENFKNIDKDVDDLSSDEEDEENKENMKNKKPQKVLIKTSISSRKRK